MKKFVILLLISISFFPNIVIATQDEESLLKGATNGVLMESSTGKLIYEKNSHEKVAVASLTKMVAQIIILENIENKVLNWDDIVTVSSNSSGMGGTQIFLTAGEKMSVRDLFKGISMASANDVAMSKKQQSKLIPY